MKKIKLAVKAARILYRVAYTHGWINSKRGKR